MIEIWLRAIRDAILAGVLLAAAAILGSFSAAVPVAGFPCGLAAFAAFLAAVGFAVQSILDPWRAGRRPGP